jgi:DNA-directed RNA polymerase specialized sigma24 family protein
MPSSRLPDRTETRVFSGLVDPEASDPLDRAIDDEEVGEAVERLTALPPLERAVVVLGAAGFSLEEIGSIVGLSKRAVRKRVTRANELLRGEPPEPPPA